MESRSASTEATLRPDIAIPVTATTARLTVATRPVLETSALASLRPPERRSDRTASTRAATTPAHVTPAAT